MCFLNISGGKKYFNDNFNFMTVDFLGFCILKLLVMRFWCIFLFLLLLRINFID